MRRCQFVVAAATGIGSSIVEHRHRKLLDVVAAGDPPRRLPGRLRGREKEPNQHGDDGNHHKELNEREAALADTSNNDG